MDKSSSLNVHLCNKSVIQRWTHFNSDVDARVAFLTERLNVPKIGARDDIFFENFMEENCLQTFEFVNFIRR